MEVRIKLDGCKEALYYGRLALDAILLTIGSCRIYKITYIEDIELIGLLKQDRESGFCFGKEDSDPRSEQLLCQAQRRLGSET